MIQAKRGHFILPLCILEQSDDLQFELRVLESLSGLLFPVSHCLADNTGSMHCLCEGGARLWYWTGCCCF